MLKGKFQSHWTIGQIQHPKHSSRCYTSEDSMIQVWLV